MSVDHEDTQTAEETSADQREVPDKVINPEKSEEAKLKTRYPNLGNKPGGSDLLRKRLQKGVSWLYIMQHTESP
ncbi:cAMP-regulated phosphoprotein 19 [Liparis tanakae]|uniref:cAMP-regulated phosphoprotein 19 n=1 Tax=Liparis tanakae TaxID=230148 RepID=A0A4Z2EC37_9TELE|nr:cAMP-regulated phosphoprotein 19 [Liparis tanakae]